MSAAHQNTNCASTVAFRLLIACVCLMGATASSTEPDDSQPSAAENLAAESYAAGIDALRNRQSADAQIAFEKAVELAPENCEYRQVLAAALYNCREYAACLRELKVAAELSPDDPGILLQRAFLASASKRDEHLPVAIECALQYVAHADVAGTEASGDGYRLMACAYERLDDYERARRSYENALEVDTDPELRYASYIELAKIAYRNRDAIKVRLLCASAVEANGGPTAKTYHLVGLSYVVDEDFRQAKEEFGNAITISPDRVDSRLWRGACWWMLGDAEQTVSDMTAALTATEGVSDRQRFDALRLRAQAYTGLNEWEKADQDFVAAREAFDLLPADLRVKVSIRDGHSMDCCFHGHVLERLADYQGAIESYNRGIATSPANGNNYRALALLLASCTDERFRDGKTAVGLAARTYSLQEEQAGKADRVTLCVIAMSFAECGDFANAIEYQREAIAEFEAGNAGEPDNGRGITIVEARQFLDGFESGKVVQLGFDEDGYDVRLVDP